jgi:hypothetical protein
VRNCLQGRRQRRPIGVLRLLFQSCPAKRQEVSIKDFLKHIAFLTQGRSGADKLSDIDISDIDFTKLAVQLCKSRRVG